MICVSCGGTVLAWQGYDGPELACTACGREPVESRAPLPEPIARRSDGRRQRSPSLNGQRL